MNHIRLINTSTLLKVIEHYINFDYKRNIIKIKTIEAINSNKITKIIKIQ